jgi:uncharacterized surface protein with fasciclin (FAS1) repeats
VNIRRTVSLALAGAALVTATAVPAVSAATPIDGPAGSVLHVLEADGTAFDSNWYDFDIVEAAARAVVDTKGVGNTKVAALANPDAALTVFAPNDRAFQVLAKELTGKWYGTEAGVVNGIVGALGADAINTLETVLLYHVVGGKVDFATAKSLSGESVPTVLGPTIKLKYYGWINTLVLADKDTDDANPWVVNSKRNIETSNGKSIIHGISLVLRPVNLP